MGIWKKEISIAQLNEGAKNMVKLLDIQFTKINDDSLEATMPVDSRTQQPYGILHGGASVVLAESVGSLAGYLCLADPNKITVGLDINANHIRPVTSGLIYAKAYPVHLGKTTQVWQIDITNGDKKIVCVSRLTLSVIDAPQIG